jgi:uncharacterized membrane protein
MLMGRATEGLMQISWHDPATIIHGTIYVLFFVMASILVVSVLYRSFVVRLGPELSHARRRWEEIFLIAMVLLGWGAALLGTFWTYPQQLLASGPQAVGLNSRSMESKELVTWMATIVMTMVAYILIRYKDRAEEHRRLRVMAAVFALAALLATGFANGMGVLLGK